MNYDLDPELRTVGHMMRELGYYTAYKGKWHLTREIDQPVAGKSVEEMDLGEIPTPRLHEIMEKYGFSDYHGIGDVIGKSKGGYFFDSVTTGQTISWLRNTGRPLNDENKPWFAAVNLVNPHDVMFIDTDEHGEQVQWKGPMDKENHTLLPTQPPHNQIYQQSWPDYPLPANRHQPLDEPGRPAAHKEYQNARAVMEGQFPDEDRRWRKLLDYYFNCIRDNDQHLEAILNELDNLQLTQNTIIVFTADHGELGGSHQMHGKGSSVYKEQIDRGQHALAFFHILFQQLKRCDAEERRENDDADDGGWVSPGQVSKRVLRHEGKDQLRDAEIRYFPHIVALDGVQTGGLRAALDQTLGGEAEHIGHQHANQGGDQGGEQQSTDAQEANFPQLRGIVQAGHRAKDGGEDQRHNNHLQQLDVTVADYIEPLDGILQHLAVRPVD